MADSAVVGILKTMLTMDTSSYDAGAKKAAAGAESVRRSMGGLKDEVVKLTPLSERMVKSLGGDKLLYTANSLTAAVTKLGGAQKLTEAEQAKVNRTLTTAIDKYKSLGQQAPAAMVDLERATRKTADAKSFLTAKVVALGAAAGTMAAQLAGTALRSVIRLGREALDTAGHLVDLSAQTGLSTVTLQRMDAVAGQTGTTLDVLTNAAFRLQNRIAGGGDTVRAAVTALGLDLEKLRQQKPDQQFETTIVALGKMENATAANQAAVELFGLRLAKTAIGAAKDYQSIADAALASTDAQLQALDVIGDRLDKFSKDFKATTRGMLADALFVSDEFKRLSLGEFLFLGAATLNPQNLAKLLAQRGQARAMVEAQRKETAAGTQEQIQAEIDYVKALEAARAELGKLDAAERKQLDAARQMGKSNDDLEDMVVKFGVSAAHAETVLTLYNAAMREGDRASKDLTKSQKELAEAAQRSNQAWFDVQVQLDRAMLARQRSQLQIIGDLNAVDLESALAKLEQPRSPLTIINDLQPNLLMATTIEDVERQLEELERPARQLRELIEGIFAPVIGGVADAFGELFAGSGERPNPRLMSAEAYTRALQEFESKWDRFLGRIGRSFRDLLSNLLSMFINEFLGGMIRALAGSALGQRLGNWVAQGLGWAGGGGGGGGVGGQAAGWAGQLFGFGGGGGAAAIPGAAAVPSTASLLGAAPAGASGGGAAGGGSGAAGAGITLGVGLGIGFAVGLAAWALMDPGTRRGRLIMDAWKRGSPIIEETGEPTPDRIGRIERDTFLAILNRQRGFSPPRPMPAISPVGMSVSTESASTSALTGGRWQPVVVHNHISTIDAKGVRDFVRSREFSNSISRAVEDNTNGLTSRWRRALAP